MLGHWLNTPEAKEKFRAGGSLRQKASETMKKTWAENGEKLSASRQTPEARQRARKTLQQIRETPGIEEKRITIINSPGVRSKIALALAGKKQSDETILKKRQSCKAFWDNMTDEEREQRVNALRKYWDTHPEYREKILQKFSLGAHTPEARAKKSNSLKARWQVDRERMLELITSHLHTPEVKAKQRKAMKKLWSDPKFAKMLILANHSPEAQKKRKVTISKSLKKFWDNISEEEAKERVMKSFRKRVRPTYPEKILGEWLECHYPKEWQYNGNGNSGLVIGRKVPDFININGEKAVIEMFGEYWHNVDKFPDRMTEDELVVYYSQWGFKCLVLWEKEVYSEEIMGNKIVNFVETVCHRRG